MKEAIIFLSIFLIVFCASVFIFNGRFIYNQIKYSLIGEPPVSDYEFYEEGGLISEKRGYVLPIKLAIPAIAVEAPVVLPQGNTENDFQKGLEQGVIYMPGSSFLEEKGTMVIMGHSSAYPWYRGSYGSIFALLNKLNPNDEIHVFSENKRYIYRVIEKQIKAPKDLVFENQEDEAILYLVSCWPVNTAWKRLMVKASLAIDKK